jgi:uncharacterized membrane protein
MLYAAIKAAHLLALIVWIGGMACTQFFLRPALTVLDPPQRLRLMHEVLGRFLAAVTVAAGTVLASGVWMIGHASTQAAETGGHLRMPIAWLLMAALGLLMMAIFAHIRWRLYPRLSRAFAAANWPAGAAAMGQIRGWVSVNLAIGVGVVAITVVGAAV